MNSLQSLYLSLTPGDYVPAGSYFVSLDSLFTKLEEAYLKGQMGHMSLAKELQQAFRAVYNRYFEHDKNTFMQEIIRLGVHMIQLTSRMVLHNNTVMNEFWEQVALIATFLVDIWRPGIFTPTPTMTKTEKRWIVAAMNSSVHCPNAFLRQEMLRFVAMFDLEDYADPGLGEGIACGCFKVIEDMTLSSLVPEDNGGLLASIRKIIHNIYMVDLLQTIVLSASTNIRNLKVLSLERALVHLVVLLRKAAETLLWMARRKVISPLRAIEEVHYVLETLHLLVVMPGHYNFYETPGVFHVAANAIATTATCIVKLPGSAKLSLHFTYLLKTLDDFFHSLSMYEENGTVKEELCRYHGRTLSFVVKKMNEFGYKSHFVPTPMLEVKAEQVPGKFLDSITGRLMETPVMLEQTQQVVDRSTLLTLLFTADVDPLTGESKDCPHTPLPELQEQIISWRNSSSSVTSL